MIDDAIISLGLIELIFHNSDTPLSSDSHLWRLELGTTYYEKRRLLRFSTICTPHLQSFYEKKKKKKPCN